MPTGTRRRDGAAALLGAGLALLGVGFVSGPGWRDASAVTPRATMTAVVPCPAVVPPQQPLTQRRADRMADEDPPPNGSSSVSGSGSGNDDNPWLTAQSCYELASGVAEVCDLTGPVCWDTVQWQVRVGVPTAALYSRGSRNCARDPRHDTPSRSCAPTSVMGTPNLPPHAYAAPAAWAQAVGLSDGPRAGVLGALRAEAEQAPTAEWGPEGGLQPEEVSWEAVAAATAPADAARLGPEWARHAATARSTAALDAWHDAAGATLRTLDGGSAYSRPAPHAPTRVTWLLPRPGLDAPGAAYLVDMQPSWFRHAYHHASAVLAVFAAKRANASEEVVARMQRGGGGGGGDRVGGAVRRRAGGPHLPPISSLALLGSYAGNGEGEGAVAELPAWARGLLPFSTQPATRLVLNAHVRRDADLRVPDGDPAHWVCTPRAVTGTVLPSLFASAGDADAFRLLAYALANVTTPASGAYPPRRLSILQRDVRGIFNRSALEALAAGTGLPWGYITPATLGGSWGAQVAAFAGTGILIAPHGGALVNAAFLPRHAVLIEVFPAYYRPSMYGELAGLAGVRYYPVLSRHPTTSLREVARASPAEAVWASWASLQGAAFAARCNGNTSHPSHLDASWVVGMGCAVGKHAAADVSYAALGGVLEQAMDDIGCRDGYCAVGGAMGGPYEHVRAGGRRGVRQDW